MTLSKLRRKVPVFMITCTLGLTTSAVLAGEKGKAAAKGKQKLEARENHGREAGELPFGLIRHTQKGELPTGLQKKKDEDGQLTRGLDAGGRSVRSTGKAKKLSNR